MFRRTLTFRQVVWRARARKRAPRSARQMFAANFRDLLDATPGGRGFLDASLGRYDRIPSQRKG